MATRSDIIGGLQILEKYDPGHHSTAAEHDVIYGGDSELPITPEDRQRLEDMGWFIDEETDLWARFV